MSADVKTLHYQPMVQSVSIAVVGNLNPPIFTPAWLRLNDIIDDTELEAAKTVVVHPEITDFTIGTLQVQVIPQKISISTSELPFVHVADMMSAIFGGLLTHTPVHMLGINFQIHFNLNSGDQRTRLGRRLAPIDPWGNWGRKLDAEDRAFIGGLRSLTMEEETPNKGSHGGYRRVQIEPSLFSEQLKTSGVFMAVNDHYELNRSTTTTQDLLTTIEKNFDKSLSISIRIVSDMMNFASTLE